MHILIVTFHLDGIGEEEFRTRCEQVAPVFAAIPDLISKVWLANPDKNTYGSVYLWESRAALTAYRRSDVFQSMTSDPRFAHISVREFDVIDQPTAITHGLAAA